MLRYLAEDEVDAAFSLIAGELPDGLVVDRLSTEEVVATFPPGTAPKRAWASARELANRVLMAPRSGSAIKHALDEFFAAAGVPLRVSLESGDPFLLRFLVSEGFGAAVLPRSLIEREGPPVEVRALRPRVTLPVALLYREGRHRSPAASAFIEFVRQSAGEAE
jgi:DNA-binding transcriptional LysR family regulator